MDPVEPAGDGAREPEDEEDLGDRVMVPAQWVAFSFQESQRHDCQEKKQGALGGEQVEPVEGRRNGVELDAAPDPFDLHDDRARDVAAEPDDGRQDVTPADQ